MFSTAFTAATMTNRDKIKYLKRYINLDREIERKLEEVARLRSKVERITSTLSDMPYEGKKENSFELAVCEMLDREREADNLIDQLCDLRKQVNYYILTTGDNDERLLVILNGKE
jgi:hypothetical protein